MKLNIFSILLLTALLSFGISSNASAQYWRHHCGHCYTVDADDTAKCCNHHYDYGCYHWRCHPRWSRHACYHHDCCHHRYYYESLHHGCKHDCDDCCGYDYYYRGGGY